MTYGYKEDGKNRRQKLYAKAFAGFFALMLLFTILSRAADSFAVAKVYTEKPKRGRLYYETLCEGRIEPLEKLYISFEEGFRIQEIKAEPGQAITSGEPLIILDNKDIEEKLFTAEMELKIMELKEQSLYLNTYELSGDEAVQKAETQLQRARNDMELNKEINGGIVLEADIRAVEDALLNLQGAIEEKEKAEADNEVAKEKNEIDKKTAELEIQLKNKEIDRLRQLVDTESVISAERGGTVDEIYVNAGEKTSGGNIISIIPEDSEYYFKAETDKEKTKYIRQGDMAEITLEGQKIPIKDGAVKWVKLSAADKNTAEIAVKIPKRAELYNGMGASMKHVSPTEEYEKIIPLRAVRSSTGGDYVLAVKEVNTVMGNETAAYRVIIEVLGEDGTNAAVTGLSDEEVIVSGNKSIEESDRVRVIPK